jgi:isopentenyl-diphosphate Delta-isomerase
MRVRFSPAAHHMEQQFVILVDEHDTQIGIEEKIAAHKKALLHRAFSILIYNSKGEMLLQQRALDKYHAGGLWSNTCCSHPKPAESLEDATQRRLQEELGFHCEITKQTHFIYNLPVGNGLTEHEYLHVYSGTYEGDLQLNPAEVADTRWITETDLQKETSEHPELFTPWFLLLLTKVPFGK